MGAYFRIYDRGEYYLKTLVKKQNGSSYPKIAEFQAKFELLKKYLIEFMANSEMVGDGKLIRIKQVKIKGQDIFQYLNNQKNPKPQGFSKFIDQLDLLYSNTQFLPDLLNDGNILVTNQKEIKIVDLWPIFNHERVEIGDLNQESFDANIEKFAYLKRCAES